MTNLNHTNLLKPLKTAEIGVSILPLQNEEKIYSTNIDGFPYILVEDTLQVGWKINFYGELEIYTVKQVDEEKQTVELKMDKILDINNREVVTLKKHYQDWGEHKEANKVKANHRVLFDNVWQPEFNIEGKLSKNQVIQYQGNVIKIETLDKNKDGIIQVVGQDVSINYKVDAIYPYVEQGEIKDWYFNMQDVWLRQNKEWKKKRGL